MAKKSRAKSVSQSIRQERNLCHNSFWKYVIHLFDDNTTKRINPAFPKDKAFPFFKSVYSSHPMSFHQPSWMPSVKLLHLILLSSFSIEEISGTIKRSNALPLQLLLIKFHTGFLKGVLPWCMLCLTYTIYVGRHPLFHRHGKLRLLD